MPRALFVPVLLGLGVLASFGVSSRVARAQEVWSGSDFTFTKLDFASTADPQNQDRITDNVWITRGTNQGIFNIAAESAYVSGSPADTEWATQFNNDGLMVTAENWSNLTFEPWVTAYRAEGSGQLPSRLMVANAVLHLITDDIYLDIRFTEWTTNAGGGGFAYQRAVAPPSMGATGDYNLNGVVDAADYTVWRDTLNQNVTPGEGADGDQSGTIDQGDYEFWKQHFGETISAPATSSAQFAVVPEPLLAPLLLAILTGCLPPLTRSSPRRGGIPRS